MSWLRVDDLFAEHPKFSGWRVADKWDLLRVLTYCARYRTDGRVPDDPELLGVSRRFLDLAEESGWFDRDGLGLLVVHDWDVYNSRDVTAAERQKRRRRNGAGA